MTLYAPALWLGGCLRFDTLEAIEIALREASEKQPEGYVKRELVETANMVFAELTRRPKAICDLI